MLKEKDAMILDLTFFADMPTMEIADKMRDYFDSDPSEMSRKDVQTRISQWKNRALAHLVNIITKNQHLFPAILAYIRKKKREEV